MRPINQLPIKIGKDYIVARHNTGHGPFFVRVKVLFIKEGKLNRWNHVNTEYWSIKTEILDTHAPAWAANAGSISWIHHEGIREFKNRWLHLDGTDVVKEAS